MTTVDPARNDTRYVLSLVGPGRAGADRVGAKAASLGELAAAGFPVPDGFVLTAEAFERFLEANGLAAGGSPQAVEAAPLPPEVEAALRSAAAPYGDASLAVRSSAIAEDRADASFAGQYETVLDVRGADALVGAVRRCWASAFGERLAAYRSRAPADAARRSGLAVLVQRLVPAEAAGVALTANPVTGDRSEVVVAAVRGLGDRLVSGRASADEWVVRGGAALCRAAPEGALDAEQARAVAELARRVEAHRGGVPQDVEWALAGGELFLLQARPITALPAPVAWQAPLPGGWARHFRLGEWLGDPVTPLFEGWLLSRIEERLAANFRAWGGAPPRPPHHVLVNGWYFASLNFAPETPAGLLWLLVRHWLPKLLVQPRRAAVLVPPLAGLGVELCLREWREVVLPRYRELVRAGEARVDRLTPDELVRLVDDLADAAGEYFFSIVCVAGYASKTELPLAAFYRRHLAPRLGGSHQRLLRGLAPAAGRPDRHAVQGLDWVHPTLGERAPALPDADPAAAERHAATVADRRRAEAEARAALAGDAKRLAEFDHLLARAQRFAPIREEQVAAFTLAWPLMRRALLRLGEGLRARGVLTAADDVFFLKRDELLGALDAGPAPGALAHAVAERRRAWERQRRLAPPLVVGEPAPMIRRFIAQAENAFRQGAPPTGGVRGLPASPGRATGPARVIRRPEEFDRLLPGEVLVAPVTTPAWTPLFARAAAVVTDTGSPIAHASLVAREYGIPAVVGCADATVRLADGRTVTVDGNRGVVEVQG